MWYENKNEFTKAVVGSIIAAYLIIEFVGLIVDNVRSVVSLVF